MNKSCGICLEPVETDGGYHPRCLRDLLGMPALPAIEVELAKLHTLALAMVGHTSLSGIQRKISVSLSTDRSTLQVAVEGGRFILKPQTQTAPAFPENEHTTMRLAELSGIEIPPCGLVPLKDGSIAYLVARFDRPRGGGKLRQEDFCQLLEMPPRNKYRGSAEKCMAVVKRCASEPLIEVLKLYRLFVFAWWCGNGDMHLKNLALLSGADGRTRLSPAYDLMNSQLVIADDPLALSVCGKKSNLDRKRWLAFAEHSGLRRPAAERVLNRQREVLGEAVELLRRSWLPDDLREPYEEVLRKNSRALEQ